MSESCPDCGSAIEYASRPATVKTGHCGSCGQEFTFLRTVEGIGIPTGAAAPSGAHGAGDEEAEEGEVAGLSCNNCGAELELTLGAGGAIEATCASCGAVQRYVLEGAAPAGRERRERSGPPREGRGGFESGGAPRARPCRECGGPLKFTTLPDGMIEGKCESCGNTFVLPPREDRRGGGGRSSYPPRGRGPPRYGDRRGGGGGRFRDDRRRGGGGGGGRYRRRDDSE